MTTIEVKGVLKSDEEFPLKTYLKLDSNDFVYLNITIMEEEE